MLEGETSHLHTKCVKSWKSAINDDGPDVHRCVDEPRIGLYIQTAETTDEVANQITAGGLVQPDDGESIRARTRREYPTAV